MADNKKQNIDMPDGGVSQELDNFELWVVENRKRILVVSAILVVVIAAAICTWKWYKGAEDRSRTAFAQATTQEQIESALKKYSKGPAAAGARVRLAEIYGKAKAYDKAAATLSEIVKDPTVDLLVRGGAEVTAGRYFENAKKEAEAIKAYTAAANNAAYQESTRVEAAYCLGCLYTQKKDFAKARDAFKRAVVTNPTSQVSDIWSKLAQRALDRLPAGK